MEAAEARQQQQNQFIALFLVILGLVATFVGCHFHYTELTTAAVGVVGIGGGMLTNQRSGNTLHAGGGIAVSTPDPS